MAICLWACGQLADAGELLEGAVRLDPQFAPAQAWLGQWYLDRGVIEAALEATKRAMELAPDNATCIQARAWVLEAAGDSDGAWRLVQRLVAAGQMDPSLARLYGRLASRYGQQQQALAVISRMIRGGLDPLEAALNFTAAELLDKSGRYDEAFACATSGHAPRPATYDPVAQTKIIDRIIEFFTPARLRTLARATNRSEKPVFIVGMPRSGTTLVEQILAAHPAVYGAGELDFVEKVLYGTIGMLRATLEDFPECLDRLTVEQADGMAEIYLQPLAALSPQAQRITDKMPLNFLQLGFISLLLPGARVIHCRRNPMDTCVSCYLTHFNAGHEFTHNLSHLGHFYRQYERLMAHWKKTLDLPILDICYEETIADAEAQSRRMIEFLGLPWDDRCLSFYDSARPVVTASVQQVRRPIYNTSIQRWRHYEKYLGPLKASLWGN